MAIIDSGLGWSVDSQYLCTDTDILCVITGRSYWKINNTPAIVVVNGTSSTYHQPALLSTDPDSVAFRASSGGPFNYTNTYEINGVTWYYNSGNHGFFNGEIQSTRFPVITDLNTTTASQSLVEELLRRAQVSFTETYTIEFNANGGSGTMSNQTVECDVSTALSLNTFTRNHYQFIGWSTNSSGIVEYADGQNVINLTDAYETITLYAVWELIPYYTVTFNANGGTGSMSPQEINTDEPTRLTVNTFTREEYIFQGWSKTASGSVMYTDGEEVTNIGESGTTVTLYAIWKKAPISLTLQTNNSEKNKLDKDIDNIETVYGTLRSECSIIDPVITFEADLNLLKTCNYMTIPKFGRSYFVTNIRSIREGLVELTAHVDVLSSFKTQIRSNKAIIGKSENEWNLYLNDGSLKTYQNSRIFTKEFPSGFSTQSFVLAIAGS